jgi:hypothetical protein
MIVLRRWSRLILPFVTMREEGAEQGDDLLETVNTLLALVVAAMNPICAELFSPHGQRPEANAVVVHRCSPRFS